MIKINDKTNVSDISNNSMQEDYKEHAPKNLSKYDYDLYHENLDIALPVVSVSRISLPSSGCKWRVFVNSKLVFTIEGSRLGKKDKIFLSSVEGAGWLLGRAKIGIKTMGEFKKELRARQKKA